MTIRIQTKLALLVGFVILSFLTGMSLLYHSELAKVHDIMDEMKFFYDASSNMRQAESA